MPSPSITSPQVAINDIGSAEDFMAAIDKTIKYFNDGDIVEGTIVKVDRDEVLLDIGYKTEGVIPSRELSIKHDVDPSEVVSVGDEIEALVLTKEDKEGRLIQVVRPPRVEGTAGFNGGAPITDRYTYDTQGNRTSHTNAAGRVEHTGYDAEGRVVRTLSFEQREVSYTYTYDASIKGVGMLAIGGWKKVTTVGGVRSTSDSNDYFGHLAGHVDVAGRDVVCGYDHAAHLIRQTSSAGQEVDFEYYANGYLKRSVDRALRMESYFEYDKDGNRTHESYAKLENNGEKTYYQIADITYDELNRSSISRSRKPISRTPMTRTAIGARSEARTTPWSMAPRPCRTTGTSTTA